VNGDLIKQDHVAPAQHRHAMVLDRLAQAARRHVKLRRNVVERALRSGHGS
jgi:hypothetical protein